MLSLKGFHLLFIVISIVTCAGFVAWAAHDFTVSGSVTNLVLGAASAIGGLLLTWYLVKAISRFKRIGPLA